MKPRDVLEGAFMLIMIIWAFWSGPVLWHCWQSWELWQARQQGAALMIQMMGDRDITGFEIVPRYDTWCEGGVIAPTKDVPIETPLPTTKEEK